MDMEPNKQPPELTNQIQAFLFAEGGTLSFKKLAQLTGTNEGTMTVALDELSKKLDGTALSLIRTETAVTLAIAAPESALLKSHYEKELARDIGEAGLEVLAVLLYRGPSTRAHIDYIRGVNTSSTIRTLLARGLIERVENPTDSREYIYRPTVELLAHVGATHERDIPEYGTISNELKAFEEDAGPFNHEYATDTIDGESTLIDGGTQSDTGSGLP